MSHSKKLDWIVSRGISMREAAQQAGFEIDRLKDFQQRTQLELRRLTVTAIVEWLDEDWGEKRDNSPTKFGRFSDRLADVVRGVYVLCLDRGLCVSYEGGNSKVLYVGKGAIRSRIKSHLEQKLLEFFLEVPGLTFQFWMIEPRKKAYAAYYHDFVTDLLWDFSKKYGSDGSSKYLPLLNKNEGRQHHKNHAHPVGWNTPLKNTKANYKCALSSHSAARTTIKLSDE